MNLTSAYSATGGAWQAGPGRVYDRLAEVLLDHSPVPLAGSLVLDLGAGTGAASRAALARGARVVAMDAAEGMLRHDRAVRPPAVVADALALPFADRSIDVVAAAFSLNHLDDPVAGLAETRRVLRRAGALLASAYAEDDTHPVKQAAEAAAAELGWSPEPWVVALKRDAVPHLATVERAIAAADAAGLTATAVHDRVTFPELGPADLVDWRLGMAQLAPFVATLDADTRHRLRERAIELLVDPVPLIRSVIVLTATAR